MSLITINRILSWIGTKIYQPVLPSVLRNVEEKCYTSLLLKHNIAWLGKCLFLRIFLLRCLLKNSRNECFMVHFKGFLLPLMNGSYSSRGKQLGSCGHCCYLQSQSTKHFQLQRVQCLFKTCEKFHWESLQAVPSANATRVVTGIIYY